MGGGHRNVWKKAVGSFLVESAEGLRVRTGAWWNETVGPGR